MAQLKERYLELVNTFVNTPKANDPITNASNRNLYLKSGAEGGSRTHTPLRGADFKSAASTVPPPGHGLSGMKKQNGLARSDRSALLEATGGFEPPNRAFAELRLRPLGYVAPITVYQSYRAGAEGGI